MIEDCAGNQSSELENRQHYCDSNTVKDQHEGCLNSIDSFAANKTRFIDCSIQQPKDAHISDAILRWLKHRLL